MGIGEEAVASHGNGMNCAQCVLRACGKYTGLDEDTAIAVAAGFGGGVRCGEICGAISGAVMAVGLAMGSENSMRVGALSKACSAAFREKYGVVRCLDLKRAGIPCDDLIKFGAETAEKLILENKE